MGDPRGQHCRFAHRMLPQLFFSDPARLLGVLSEDGARLLQVLWHRAADGLGPEELVASNGLDFSLHGHAGSVIALVKLPEPKEATEAYFLALGGRHKARSEGHFTRTRTAHLIRRAGNRIGRMDARGHAREYGRRSGSAGNRVSRVCREPRRSLTGSRFWCFGLSAGVKR